MEIADFNGWKVLAIVFVTKIATKRKWKTDWGMNFGIAFHTSDESNKADEYVYLHTEC